MSCVVCESYAVQNEPGYGYTYVLYDVQCDSLTLYVAQRTSIARLILNSIQLTQQSKHVGAF